VINNGLSSEYFNPTNGVTCRQGDPLSYLFLSAVRENMKRKGIVIDKQITKLLQYADDTTAVLSDTCKESPYNFTFSIARQI